MGEQAKHLQLKQFSYYRQFNNLRIWRHGQTRLRKRAQQVHRRSETAYLGSHRPLLVRPRQRRQTLRDSVQQAHFVYGNEVDPNLPSV